jgi:hypothetical protein
MPRVTTPRTWPGSGLLAAGVVGALLVVVVGLYAMGGSGGSNGSLFGPGTLSPEAGGVGLAATEGPRAVAPITTEPALTATPATAAETPVAGETPTAVAVAPPAGTMPNLQGQTLAEASATLRSLDVDYLAVQVPSDLPVDQVIRQSVSPGSEINPEQVVTLEVSRGS